MHNFQTLGIADTTATEYNTSVLQCLATLTTHSNLVCKQVRKYGVGLIGLVALNMFPSYNKHWGITFLLYHLQIPAGMKYRHAMFMNAFGCETVPRASMWGTSTANWQMITLSMNNSEPTATEQPRQS